MTSQNDKDGSPHVKAAFIGGVFVLLAACISGFFLVLNTMVNNGVIVFGASNPRAEPTAEVSSPTNTSLPDPINTSAVVSTPSVEQWARGNLIVDENFNDKEANNWKTKSGNVEIVEVLENGQSNYVLQLESGLTELTLPENINDYAVEAKIMQVSGNEGLGIIQIRMIQNAGQCGQEYKTYIDVTQDWLSLVEDDPIKCDENRDTGLFGARKIDLSMKTWYLLRIEAKGAIVRVYLDNVLQVSDEDDKLKSNVIALTTCCSVHRFYFDDVKVWELP